MDDDHSSRPRDCSRARATYPVASDGPSCNATLFGLAPCGVLPATGVTAGAVRSYRTFSPLLASALAGFGGAVSFLCHWSVRLPCPGVTRRTALWSSDFPLYDPPEASRTAIVWVAATP